MLAISWLYIKSKVLNNSCVYILQCASFKLKNLPQLHLHLSLGIIMPSTVWIRTPSRPAGIPVKTQKKSLYKLDFLASQNAHVSTKLQASICRSQASAGVRETGRTVRSCRRTGTGKSEERGPNRWEVRIIHRQTPTQT